MEAVRIETTIQPNGRVTLNDLPFEDGTQVEIIVLDTNGKGKPPTVNPLKGTLLKYEDPFEDSC